MPESPGPDGQHLPGGDSPDIASRLRTTRLFVRRNLEWAKADTWTSQFNPRLQRG